MYARFRTALHAPRLAYGQARSWWYTPQFHYAGDGMAYTGTELALAYVEQAAGSRRAVVSRPALRVLRLAEDRGWGTVGSC